MIRALLTAALLAAYAASQTTLVSGPFASAGSHQHKHVVRDPTGTLYALSVSTGPAGDRPLLLLTSTDGGNTWAQVPVSINDPASGLNGSNPTNGCAMAIDGAGTLHLIWGSYYYPSYYSQHYRQYDPNTGSLSTVVSLSGATGATSTSRTSAMAVAVDANDTVWVAAHGTQNWRTRLLMSDQPGAANLSFTDLGPVSVSASAQNVRMAIDNGGLIHCSYYRNVGAGEYFHRIYDPTTGWLNSTRIGNTTPSNDFLGAIAADDLGFVHVLYGEDLGPSSTWNFQYRRWDAFNSWSAPTPVFSATTAQHSGIANYRISTIGCDEASGEVFAVFRNLASGGHLEVVRKDILGSNFTSLVPLTPPSGGQHAYYVPSIRGTLWPPFNRTGTDLDITWRQDPAPGPYQLVFQRVSTSGPAANLSLVSPATVGAATALSLSSPGDPSLAYFCGFSTGNVPGTTLFNGQFVPLNDDWLLQFSMVPNNGVLLNNWGTLDSSGFASVVLNVPNVPSLSGITVYSAFVVEAPGATSWQLGTISPSLAITIQ